MTLEEINDRFQPAIDQMIDRCRVADDFVDKEKFQVLVATVWGNVVLDPVKSGVEESALPDLHDFMNQQLDQIVGAGETVTNCFEFIMSKKGEDSLIRQQVSVNHIEFLHYFAGLILQDVRLPN